MANYSGGEYVFRHLLAVLDKILEVSCVVLLLTCVGLTAGQVFWRYVLQDPLTWSEEAARIVFIYVTFLAAAVTLRRRRMIRITVLVDSLPARWRHGLDLFSHTLVGIFLVILIVQSQVIVNAIGAHEAPATGIPMFVFYLSLPIASLAMLVYLIEQIVESIQGFRHATPVIPLHIQHAAEAEREEAALLSARGR